MTIKTNYVLLQALNVVFFVLAYLFVETQFQAAHGANWKLLAMIGVAVGASFVFGTVRYFYVLINELQDEAKLDRK